MDFYNTEAHSSDLYLPIFEEASERQFVGFFHTGAYQDQLAGYGGIKHCMIPSPKHVVIEYDKNGKLVDWLYAKEQSYQSMLKILGYIK